ncbi:MAG TPA: DUF6531 domain-containing protein, partial [Anaerolineales bacterium]|nr:DUF6531 domain-containing protein [Anaerolineales bacterium]
MDLKLQQPIAERHILGYQPLASPINLYWSSAGVTNVYVPIQPQHAQWIVGVVITQPAGGSGTMAIQLGDTWWPPLWIDPSITQKAYIADPSVWPPDKQNLYTASEKQNGDNYLAEDYAGVSSAVYNGVLRFPVQSSWANGLRFQYYLYGGLGRPSGQLLGYVYLGDGIPNESLLSPYCSPSETCVGTYKNASRAIGDPINVRNGGFGIAGPEISFDTTAGNIVFQPNYASLTATQNNSMGYGWTHNLETRLIFSGDPGGESGVVKFKAHSANLYRFNILPSGTYQAYPGVLASLLKNPGPPITYTLTTKDKIIYQFDEEGRLLFIQDEKSNQKSYTYDVSGLLQHVEGPGGNRFLELAYDAGGLLTSVTDHSSRALSFGYDANGDLVSITDVLGEVWTYSYDAQHRLIEIIDPDLNTVVENAYDAQGRVTHQYDGLGNLVANLVYATGNTKVYDAAGNWTTYYFDSRSGAVTRTLDDLGNSEYSFQDMTFRPLQIFDENNEVTQLTWSQDGANLLE